MSRYLQLNDQDEAAELSSNTGWSQFSDWVNGLDAGEFPALSDFVKSGSTNQPQLVADQIESAVSDSPPDGDVSGIADSLREYLDGEDGIASVV